MRHKKKDTHCIRNHEFTVENTYIDKRGSRCCRTCRNLAMKKHCKIEKNRLARNARSLKWRRENLDRLKKYRDTHKDKARDRMYRRQFNTNLLEFNAKDDEQNHCCAICGKTEEENGRPLANDHDHETRKNRDLLCIKCNAGLGCFRDDPFLLQKAIEYLRFHSKVAA